mgnify:CR=1 FL=1
MKQIICNTSKVVKTQILYCFVYNYILYYEIINICGALFFIDHGSQLNHEFKYQQDTPQTLCTVCGGSIQYQ